MSESYGRSLASYKASVEARMAGYRATIQVLQGALAAQGAPALDHTPKALADLTNQENHLVGALFRVYPRKLRRDYLVQILPGNDHAVDRDPNLVNVIVSKVRKKLGKDAILSGGRGDSGFLLGTELQAALVQARQPELAEA